MAEVPPLAAFPPEYLERDDGYRVVAACAVFIVLGPVIVALRFWSRYHKRLPFGADDYLLLAALPFFFITNIFAIIAVKHGGVGKHTLVALAADPRVLTKSLQCLYVSEYSYTTLLTLVKLSILVLYRRIFPTKFMKTTCLVLGAMCIAWWVANISVTIFQCWPIWKVWEPFYLEGHCLDQGSYFMGNSVSNIIVDALILVLPVVEVKRLQMRSSLKVLVMGIFLLGGGVIVASCVRLKMVLGVTTAGPNVDFTYLMVPCWIWTNCESVMAILCASLPTMQPVLSLLFGHFDCFRGSSADKNSRSEIITIGGTGGSKATKGTSVTTSRDAPFKRMINENDSAEDAMLWAKTDHQTTCAAVPVAKGSPRTEDWDGGIPMRTIRIQRDVSMQATDDPFTGRR